MTLRAGVPGLFRNGGSGHRRTGRGCYKAKAIKNAVDIPTAAPAILAPFRIESLPAKDSIRIAFQPPSRIAGIGQSPISV